MSYPNDFLLEGANEGQRQAILNTDGPVLIIAGPGTGKTYTLVKRITYLIIEKQVKPEEIMVVTFTEKAAKELLTRIANEFLKHNLKLNLNEMYIGTFHSVCLRILKENEQTDATAYKVRLLDAFEQTYLVCRNLNYFNCMNGYKTYFAGGSEWEQALEICRYVNQLTEELADIASMENDPDQDMRFLARLVKKYKQIMIRNHVMDFSSIQTTTYDLLCDHPEVLQRFQDKIRYIMVDEYQDTNYIQEQLVFMFAGERKNICVVGDDDQGMYRFRGATIRNILEFPNKFLPGECRCIHLNLNYRSEPEIIDFYNHWMKIPEKSDLFQWDHFRFSKEIKSGKINSQSGHAVYRSGGASIDEEKTALLNMVQKLLRNGNVEDLNQIALLFKSVKSEEAIEVGNFFEENGIPIYSPRSDMFFKRQEVCQILGCIIMCFPSYMGDLKQNIFRYPITEKLRTYYIDCLKAARELFKQIPELYNFVKQTAKTISSKIEVQFISLTGIFYQLISFAPFSLVLQPELIEDINASRAARNLSEVSRILSKFSYLHDFHLITEENKLAIPEELLNIYLKFLFEDGIGEYEDDATYAPRGCISFMTIHQSKGLEFPVTVVGALSDFPKRRKDPLLYTAELRFFHRKPFEPLTDIRFFDFWRLYYTAFSRAQNLLVLTTKKDGCKYFDEVLSVLPDMDNYDGHDRFETVKEANYKRTYSFTSHISLYDGCPKQYMYYQEYSFAHDQIMEASFGTLVHAALEDINRASISNTSEVLTKEKIELWFYCNYQRIQEEKGYHLTKSELDRALRQVFRYYNCRAEVLQNVWKAEEEISLVLPDYILKGVIDLIEQHENMVDIVDYKTGPKPPSGKASAQVENYRRQLEVYAYLVEQKYEKKVKNMHLYYTNSESEDPLITFAYKKESIENTIKNLSDTVHKIETKSFTGETCNRSLCHFCDFKYLCKQERL